jgi:acetyl-CoA carboxylase carboxyl transferase subunit beta
LQFTDTEAYAVRIVQAKKNSGRDEAAMAGTCTIFNKKIAIGVLDFTFMAGSMGSVVGERLTSIIEHAYTHRLPLLIVSASGGARMQESALSLMQMAKTSAALAKLHEKGVPYISLLTNPTTGGVTASFASLGDIIIAEPDALIGFAGSRVVEQTMRQKLPPGAQRSEFLQEKGMIDCIINRHQLKERVFQFLEFLTDNERAYEEEASLRVLYGQSIDKVPQKLKELMALVEKQEKEVK